MTVKQLEVEFKCLQSLFVDLKDKIDTLVKNYENLEKKYEKSLTNKKKAILICRKCDKNFKNVKDLKSHKHETNSCQGNFQCQECEKSFKLKQELEEHAKIHQNFPCEQCEKVFDYEATLESHNEAAHEEIELFCH